MIKELEKFNEHDTDNDGKVTKDEIKDVILPLNYNYSKFEAQHLIKKADANKVMTSHF